MLTENQYEERKITLEGMSIGAVWGASRPDEFVGEKHYPFQKQKDTFFWLLNRLMREGRVRLASNGKYLEGSIDEQISLYRENFPKNQEEMEEDAFDGFWFLTEKCPGGIVWIHDNGYEDWT
ncbi:DUF596 domain-containing protein [Klebsiella sp. NPDC088457]